MQDENLPNIEKKMAIMFSRVIVFLFSFKFVVPEVITDSKTEALQHQDLGTVPATRHLHINYLMFELMLRPQAGTVLRHVTGPITIVTPS